MQPETQIAMASIRALAERDARAATRLANSDDQAAGRRNRVGVNGSRCQVIPVSPPMLGRLAVFETHARPASQIRGRKTGLLRAIRAEPLVRA